MQIAASIYTIPNVLSAEECSSYITLIEGIGFEVAPINVDGGRQRVVPGMRNNMRVMFDDAERCASLWSRISSEVPVFLNGRQAIGLNERLRFYRYDPGQRFAPHADGSYASPIGERSLLTLMVYLNEGFEGGETKFNDVRVVPQTGMALIFKHELWHEGAEVSSGRKYVLRTDVMYGPVGRIAS
jgi:predicted 2-oxoglutarate/Fe(II)-dependent dioxygenase YbiX